MYLHVGQDVLIRMRDIVGIFDLENSTVSKFTKGFLAAAQKNGAVFNVTQELPKSFILCQRDSGPQVYISQISPATLKKRAGFIDHLSNVG